MSKTKIQVFTFSRACNILVVHSPKNYIQDINRSPSYGTTTFTFDR